MDMWLMRDESHTEQLPLLRSDEFLPGVSRWARLGGVILLGAVASAIALAATIHYNVTVRANAIVRPTGDLRIVQSGLDGTVSQLRVQENQVVHEGDIIAQLDTSQLQTRQSELQNSLLQGAAELTQISAQLRALEAQIVAESNLRDRTIAAAQAELSRIERDYQQQQITAQAEFAEAQAALTLAQEQRDRYQELADTGAIAQLQISEKQQAYHSAAARLERARAALNPSSAGILAAQERIAQEQARGASTLATLARSREELLQRYVQIQNQIDRDGSSLQQVELDVKRSSIRASADGVILKVSLRNQGQVVRAGEAIAQIAPANIPFVVVASVAAQDIGKVAIGQIVHLRVSAYPYPDYGTLRGTVKAIAPDVTFPQRSASDSTPPTPITQPGTAYEVTIQPQQPYLVRNNRQFRLQAGMEARADIISRDETVLTFVLRKARLLTDL